MYDMLSYSNDSLAFNPQIRNGNVIATIRDTVRLELANTFRIYLIFILLLFQRFLLFAAYIFILYLINEDFRLISDFVYLVVKELKTMRQINTYNDSL